MQYTTITKLTLLVLLSGNFLQAVEVNFAAEFAKIENRFGNTELARHDRYALYLCEYANEVYFTQGDAETAMRACKEILNIKNVALELRYAALEFLAGINTQERNFKQALECYDTMLALPGLMDCMYKVIRLNKQQCTILSEGRQIDEEAYATELMALAQEAEQEMMRAQQR